MGAPQIILLGLWTLGLGVHLARHGQRREERYHFGGRAIATVVWVALLWWGGFFSGAC